MSTFTISSRFGAFVAVARSGAWLTRERLWVYPLVLGTALALAVTLLVATGDGLNDHWHRPIGTDFSGVWVAGQEVLAGHPDEPYDNVRHAGAQTATFGSSIGFLPWPYPPYFLVVAALLATMPYLVALAVYQGATMLAYLGVVLKVGSGLPRRDLLIAALAFPAVAINILHGHNGLLSAALLAGGAWLVPRRPGLAGVLLGLLIYKPQFALAIPVALLAGRHWRVIAAASVTSVGASVAIYAAFGAAPWVGFMDSLTFTRHVVLEMGGLDSYKIQSAFAAIRLLGGSVPAAYLAQAIITGSGLLALAWLWRSAVDAQLKQAGLIVASLLSTPYAMDYDMTMLGPALAGLVAMGRETGFPPYGKSILAGVWIMPLVARPIAMTLAFPIGVCGLLAIFGLVIAWAKQDAGARRDYHQRVGQAT